MNWNFREKYEWIREENIIMNRYEKTETCAVLVKYNYREIIDIYIIIIYNL